MRTSNSQAPNVGVGFIFGRLQLELDVESCDPTMDRNHRIQVELGDRGHAGNSRGRVGVPDADARVLRGEPRSNPFNQKDRSRSPKMPRIIRLAGVRPGTYQVSRFRMNHGRSDRHRSRPFLRLPFVWAACDGVPQPGTVAFRPSTTIAFLEDMGRSLAIQGFCNVMVSNFHGSPRHFLAIETACERVSRAPSCSST